jgi:hypothetical protein
MKGIRELLNRSPATARVAPFIVFLLLTFLQGKFGPESHYWFYGSALLVLRRQDRRGRVPGLGDVADRYRNALGL